MSFGNAEKLLGQCSTGGKFLLASSLTLQRSSNLQGSGSQMLVYSKSPGGLVRVQTDGLTPRLQFLIYQVWGGAP